MTAAVPTPKPGRARRPVAGDASLDVTVRAGQDGQAVVTVAGDLDYDTHRDLVEQLARQIADGHARLLLDLGGVTFCDSTGLGALVRVHRQALAHGGWLRLAGPSGDLRRLLQITNLDRLLPVYRTVQDASRDVHRGITSTA